MLKTKSGFTIVELLIVIVVIGILAAITIVAYNGIQKRANNASIIDGASKSIRLIQAYVAANGSYPYTGGDTCITSTIGCNDGFTDWSTANATFDANINSIGVVPRTIPRTGNLAYGIRYNYLSTRTVNGSVQPVVIQYFLTDASQQCGVSGVLTGTWGTATSSTTGYFSNVTPSDGIAKTQCIVSVPGPSS